MTVDELQAELIRRRARIMVDFDGGAVTVFLTHVLERGKVGKNVTATAGTLADALEMALLRYDSVWKL